jgi:N-acetylgalactosamine kinase
MSDSDVSSRPLSEWKAYFNECLSSGNYGTLTTIYGSDSLFLRGKVGQIIRLLDAFEAKFGEDPSLSLVRVPGRINLMGRHVDHQGGRVNVVAIPREAIFAASPREDHTFDIINVEESQFPEREVSEEELQAAAGCDSWADFLGQASDMQLKGNDWGNLLKGAALRLQNQARDLILRGANIAVFGNIPSAAGLSNSSAIAIGMLESVRAINDISLETQQLIDLGSEAEQFAGTADSAPDHAALRLSQSGQVAQFSFFPFQLEGYSPFFKGVTLLVANTGIRPDKAAAKEQFNSRVFCYEVGKQAYKSLNPDQAAAVSYLRDINPATLNLPLDEFYENLKKLPELVDEDFLNETLSAETVGELKDKYGLRKLLPWPLRGIVLYGIAECERSATFKDLVAGGDIVAAGRLMNLSHDADRVVKWENGESSPYSWRASDDYMDSLTESAKAGLEAGEVPADAQLSNQSGFYGCSIPEIDFLVDECKGTTGVFGAQMSGAGLGGCMMALAKEQTVLSLKKKLQENFKAQFDKPLSLIDVKPLPGASFIQ